MISLSQVTLQRGTRVLFRDANLQVHAGQKVGIVGANGSGKTSLLALIRGELHADAGDVALAGTPIIAHVEQQTPNSELAAHRYVMSGDEELDRLLVELEAARRAGDGAHEARVHERLELIDGYGARARAGKLLDGLGFTSEAQDRPVTQFSGGWRMRLGLARALMCRSDILLLDEPTNHLDLDAVLWLEEWLRAYAGTLLLISHDREFLDATITQVVHLERESMACYPGNYSDFERVRTERLAAQQASHAKQQREIAHMRTFVDRFRAKATKARQAQSRLKALERMQLIAPAHVDSPFRFSFREPAKLPQQLLDVDEAAVGYGTQEVLRAVRMQLAPGQRIGLLGVNGAGKSTLVKLLAGELDAMGGSCRAARDLAIGYFAQHQLEQLDANDTPIGHLRRLAPQAREQELRDHLGGFGFSAARASDSVAHFSGGEKARLVLALIIYQRPNLLLLDEPTNHLDLEMRQALASALQEFSGAMVIVAHDRHLLRTCTDELWLVAEAHVQPFWGDLDDYRRWLLERRMRAADKPAQAEPQAEHAAEARRQRRQQEAEQRRRLAPLRQELQKLEDALEHLAQDKARIERELGAPELYTDAQKPGLLHLLGEQARIARQLAQTEEDWLAASEALHAAELG